MLPSYDDVYEYLRTRGFENIGGTPTKRPTRRGLARYIYQASRNDLRAASDLPEWRRIWFSATVARDTLLTYFSVRIPADTFKYEKVRVQFLLNDPDSRRGNTDARRAYRWATQ